MRSRSRCHSVISSCVAASASAGLSKCLQIRRQHLIPQRCSTLALTGKLQCLQIMRQYEELQLVEEELARTDAGEPLATALVEQTEDQLQRPLKGYQVRWGLVQIASCWHGAHAHIQTHHMEK